MKKILTIFLFFIFAFLQCETASIRTVNSGVTTAKRVDEVKKNAVSKLPDSTEKSWITSELDSCKDTIQQQGADQISLVKENKTLRSDLQKCSDEKAEYANKAANMVIFLVVAGIIILALIILMILVRQGLLKTVLGIGKIPSSGA